MEIYKLPIEVAFITFPFIAFIITIPFLIYEYRKYGSLNIIKSIVFYSFILYLTTVYFMVIMPLPPIEEVAKYTGKTMSLTPFRFIHDITVTTNFKINDLNSLLRFLNKSTVYTVIFNVILTIPFGIYRRYFFNRKWYTVIFETFLFSLFLELTQLSGLYGIYPRPYRLFDIDDLILNTIGGTIGFIICPLITKFLPTTEELNNRSYIRGQKVSLLRRSVALFIDIIFLAISSLLFRVILWNTQLEDFYFICAIGLIFIVIPVFNYTKSIGQTIINLEVASLKKKENVFQLIIRNIILSYLVLFPYSWLLILNKEILKLPFYIIYIGICILEIINIVSYIIPYKDKHLFIYERISKTIVKSTINNEVIEKSNNIEEDIVEEK